MEKNYPLPKSNIKKYIQIIKGIGESHADFKCEKDDSVFLQNLGIFEFGDFEILTESGRKVFEAVFIRCDGEEVAVIRDLLLNYPPTIAIQQYLWGVKNVGVNQVGAVLKSIAICAEYLDLSTTHFLDLLNYTGIISYSKKLRKIKVLISPDKENVPKNVFIEPDRPFSNIMWVKRVLGECLNHIHWFDKHFQKEGLEWLWSIADANKIQEIKIISLKLTIDSEFRKQYKRFKKEMENKGIKVEWRLIDNGLVKDSHDRWIIGDKGYLRNVPNVNAINSGQRSEMNSSDNHKAVQLIFNTYWENAEEVA